MNDLEQLDFALTGIMAGREGGASWGDPTAMARALGAVRRAFGDMEALAASPRGARGVLALRVTGGRPGYLDIKYACYGIARNSGWDGRRPLDDERLVRNLLQQVDSLQAVPRRFRQCYRGLLTGYFACPAYLESAPAGDPGYPNWLVLRRYLQAHLPQVAESRPALAWAETLGRYPELLEKDPAAPWAASLLGGEAGEWNTLCRHLDLPPAWSVRVALGAQVRLWLSRREALGAHPLPPLLEQQRQALAQGLREARQAQQLPYGLWKNWLTAMELEGELNSTWEGGLAE